MPDQLRFERTSDYELVRRIVTHPKVFRGVSDDFTPPREQYRPVESDGIWYVLVKEGQRVLGLFAFVPHSVICWEVHTCLLPEACGAKALEIGRGCMAWLWKNAPCLRLFTNVPDYNFAALRFARAMGLKQFGVNEGSYMKNGKLRDLILLGIGKEEDLCHSHS